MFLLSAVPSSAAYIETLTTPFTGHGISVEVVLTEIDGDIRVDLSVEEGVADLRGVFFHIADESLLEGLSVSGDVVTAFETGDAINLGGGSNVHGGGSPCPCDIGVALGTPGKGQDDFLVASFVLSHESGSLSVSQFAGLDVGVRVTSAGAKLSGTFSTPVPEPATALLLGAGLLGMARGRRRRRPDL